MANRNSKRYKSSLEKVSKEKMSIENAVELLQSFDKTKFDMTVELVMHLGIDPRQADQRLRGSIALPHGIGKSRKVIVFCEDSQVAEAKEAGAVEAGCDELVKKIQDGWMDFDVAIAHPSVMKVVSKLGRVLGPSGRMPSPKAGTVTDDIANTVRDFAAGKCEYRNDDGGNVHLSVGKMSFENQKLVENIRFFVDFVKKSKPSGAKGTYIKKVCISGTMTPSVQLDVA